jgi:GNAT superfamily N-acetyltransferase
MPVTVRPARIADAPAIVEFQIAMARDTEGGLELDRATVIAGVGAVFADPRIGSYLVAETDGRLVACLLTLPEWSDWRNGTVLWIHSVYVVPELRRHGVFRAMYAHLRRMVDGDATLRGLRLYVHRDNVVAQRTYREMGMDGEHYRLFEWMKTF